MERGEKNNKNVTDHIFIRQRLSLQKRSTPHPALRKQISFSRRAHIFSDSFVFPPQAETQTEKRRDTVDIIA